MAADSLVWDDRTMESYRVTFIDRRAFSDLNAFLAAVEEGITTLNALKLFGLLIVSVRDTSQKIMDRCVGPITDNCMNMRVVLSFWTSGLIEFHNMVVERHGEEMSVLRSDDFFKGKLPDVTLSHNFRHAFKGTLPRPLFSVNTCAC